MKLGNTRATLMVPDGLEIDAALARITHLGIGAHQDDLEIMAFHGITTCFRDPSRWFGGIICTDGRGSPRCGRYSSMTDEEMCRRRIQEQENAARIGEYGVMAQLGYTSAQVKSAARTALLDDLAALIDACRPAAIYTHNLADKHVTHIAVALAVIEAVRALPAKARPREIYGCEIWRDLDWLPAERKIALDVSGFDNLATALTGLYDTQIAGGKHYDLATLGRRRAHATYHESHATDEASQLIFAIDLAPLVDDGALDPATFVEGVIDRFRQEVISTIRNLQG